MTAAPIAEYRTVRPVFGRSLTEQRIASAPGWKIALVVGAACGALGLSVLWKEYPSETAAGFWPPAGAALVALRVVPLRRWSWVFAGILLPTLIGVSFSLVPVVPATWWAVGNCIEPAASAILLFKLASFRRRSANHALLTFFVVAVILGPMVGGAIGSIGTVVGYDQPWVEVWRQWVLSDGLGVLVVAPLLMQLRRTRSALRTSYETAALITVVVVSTGLTFANIGRNGAVLLPYLILVGMIWAGLRFGARAVAAAGFVIALGANVATSLGLGPFSAAHRAADIITIQIFLIIALLTSFFAASMAHELADGNEINRLLTHDALEAHTRRRVEIAEELRHSIVRGEMSVLYQPIVSITSGEVAEFEALCRWNNRRFGHVAPDEFIPVAEDVGFISGLGDWVLSTACKQLTAWRMNSSNDDLRVSVNVSARQLVDVTFPGRVGAIAAEAGCPTSALTLEITETAVMHDAVISALVLKELRDMGVRLSMDDFGTGYSSMSNLRHSPLNVLKVDRSFVAGLGKVDKDNAIVSSIIDLGHSFGLHVVAEGIETVEQFEHIRRLGCDYGQGFYWSRPVNTATAGSMRQDENYLNLNLALRVTPSPRSSSSSLQAPLNALGVAHSAT